MVFFMTKTRWKYLKVLLTHKWHVFRAGLRLGGIPIWRLIVHDWSKFGPWEFGRYAENFHGDYSGSPVDRDIVSEEFAIAWLHHENVSPHHVGYHIPRTGKYAGRPLRMPNTFVREMVADMQGASIAYTGSDDMTGWMNSQSFRNVRAKMHIDSLVYLDEVLSSIGYKHRWFPNRTAVSGMELRWVRHE